MKTHPKHKPYNGCNHEYTVRLDLGNVCQGCGILLYTVHEPLSVHTKPKEKNKPEWFSIIPKHYYKKRFRILDVLWKIHKLENYVYAGKARSKMGVLQEYNQILSLLN